MDIWEIPKEEILECVEKYNTVWKKRKLKSGLLAGLFVAFLIVFYFYLRLFNTKFDVDENGRLRLQYSTAWVVNCPANHPCFEGNDEKQVVITSASWCPYIKVLNVEEGITCIDIDIYNAFAGLQSESLQKVTLPSSIELVGNSAFEGCPNLKTVIWENASENAVIGPFAFQNTAVEEFIIPEGVVSIGDKAFACNDSLKKVTLPNTVRQMSPEVFENCSNLYEVTWSDALFYMPDETFVNCENLTVLNNTDNIRSITYSALTGTQITAEQLPDNVHCFGLEERVVSDYEANKWLIDYSYTFDPDEEIAFLSELHDLPIELFQMKAEDGQFWIDGKYYTFDMNLEEFMANGNWEINDIDDYYDESFSYYKLISQESGNTVKLKVHKNIILEYIFYHYDGYCRVMLPDGVNNFGMSSVRVPYLYGEGEHLWEYESDNGTKEVSVRDSWYFNESEDACTIYITKEKELLEYQVLDAYAKANEKAGWFRIGTLECDLNDTEEKDGIVYCKVKDYKSLDRLKEDLCEVFSEECADRIMAEGSIKYEEIKNVLYATVADRGTNSYIGGETYQINAEEEGGILIVTVELLAQDDSGKVEGYQNYEFPYSIINGDIIFTDFPEIR